MQYLLTIYDEDVRNAKMSKADKEAMHREYAAFGSEIGSATISVRLRVATQRSSRRT